MSLSSFYASNPGLISGRTDLISAMTKGKSSTTLDNVFVTAPAPRRTLAEQAKVELQAAKHSPYPWIVLGVLLLLVLGLFLLLRKKK